MKVTFGRRKEKGFEFLNQQEMTIIPRLGEKVFIKGQRFNVIEVIFNLDEPISDINGISIILENY